MHSTNYQPLLVLLPLLISSSSALPENVFGKREAFVPALKARWGGGGGGWFGGMGGQGPPKGQGGPPAQSAASALTCMSEGWQACMSSMCAGASVSNSMDTLTTDGGFSATAPVSAACTATDGSCNSATAPSCTATDGSCNSATAPSCTATDGSCATAVTSCTATDGSCGAGTTVGAAKMRRQGPSITSAAGVSATAPIATGPGPVVTPSATGSGPGSGFGGSSGKGSHQRMQCAGFSDFMQSAGGSITGGTPSNPNTLIATATDTGVTPASTT